MNPLEAGLYHAVSLSKGCYVGQETLAKVHNRDAVKQQLWGLRVSRDVAAGAAVTAGARQPVQCQSRLPVPGMTSALPTRSHGEHYRCRWKADWKSHQRN